MQGEKFTNTSMTIKALLESHCSFLAKDNK